MVDAYLYRKFYGDKIECRLPEYAGGGGEGGMQDNATGTEQKFALQAFSSLQTA